MAAPPTHSTELPSENEHSRPSIEDETAWSQLASRPLNHHVARTEVVKFVIDVREGGNNTLYFLQSRRYESHYDFVSARLSDDFEDGMDFYTRVYRTEDRPFIVGSLLHYVDANVYTFELISGDQLAAERILRTHSVLVDHLFFGDALRFRPTSEIHSLHIASLGDRLPVADDDELYGALQYQPLQLGQAYGTIRIVRGEVQRGALSPRDILVTDEVPDDLPLVAALITSRFQAPLAHVAVLSGNRGTPDMALRQAVDNDAINALEGQLVRLVVTAQDYTLSAADRASAEAHWAATDRTHEPFEPSLNLERTELLEQCELDADDVDTAGAKASNRTRDTDQLILDTVRPRPATAEPNEPAPPLRVARLSAWDDCNASCSCSRVARRRTRSSDT